MTKLLAKKRFFNPIKVIVLFDDRKFDYGIWEWYQICLLNARPCPKICDELECKIIFLGTLQIIESKHIHQFISSLGALNLDLERFFCPCNRKDHTTQKNPNLKHPTLTSTQLV